MSAECLFLYRCSDGTLGIVGKGITDQDRNILSNQVLILDFLRSAAPFLVSGPVPSITGSRKKKSSEDDDDDHDEETRDEDDEQMDEAQHTRPRGSILITLRNVVPYTLWYAAPTHPPSI